MKVERVSRDDLRAIKIGEVGIFELPNFKAVESARVQASQLKRFEDMGFERLHSENPLELIYRRTK